MKVRQPELDRLVAVKLLPLVASRDEHLVERFRREARALAKLRHPGIVSLFESGISPAGHFYFVMEHVDGTAEQLDRRRSARRALRRRLR